MNKKCVLGLVSFTVLFGGCATNLPMTANISKSLMMGIRASPTKTISYEYQSEVEDGIIVPRDKETGEPLMGHPGYMHTENAVLGNMIIDYLNVKLINISPDSDAKIKIILKDFWIEFHNGDSSAKQLTGVFPGDESTVITTAKLVVEVVFIKESSIMANRVFKISAESTSVSDYSTRPPRDYPFKAKKSNELKIAETINGANNKFLAMLDQYLEAN